MKDLILKRKGKDYVNPKHIKYYIDNFVSVETYPWILNMSIKNKKGKTIIKKGTPCAIISDGERLVFPWLLVYPDYKNIGEVPLYDLEPKYNDYLIDRVFKETHTEYLKRKLEVKPSKKNIFNFIFSWFK